MKATMNFISENIDSSDKEESDGEKNIDFFYISDNESVFALNYDFDDEDEDEEDDDNKLKMKRNRGTVNNIIGNKIIKDYIYSNDNLFQKRIDHNNNIGNDRDWNFRDEIYNDDNNDDLSIPIFNKKLRFNFYFSLYYSLLI
jgi:hypothetical protein